MLYVSAPGIQRAIEYDLKQENSFDYAGLSMKEVAEHMTQFVSGLWQIHRFEEGNTRTTAVFTLQYLDAMGFDVESEPFAAHSWYFRNALVRANYQNIPKGIQREPKFLERFFCNLLLNEGHELKNRYLLLDAAQSGLGKVR